MSSALIFGCNGQDGFYLSRLLQQNQVGVMGVSRTPGTNQHFTFIQGDIKDPGLVESLIKKKPDYIFHLAANSSVEDNLLFEHQDTIVRGALNILDAAYRHSKESRVFITGSGLQFVNKELPINERDEFHPGNSYTMARIQSIYAGRYFREKGMKVYIGYLFHHDSPLRSARHLNRRIVEAVKKISEGKNMPLMIGDIKAEKEFGFAGDIAEGIFQLMQQDNWFEACIGTGKAYPVEKWLELTFSTIGKKWQDHVQINHDYISGFKRLVSDTGTMKKLNWEPKTGIEELASMMLSA